MKFLLRKAKLGHHSPPEPQRGASGAGDEQGTEAAVEEESLRGGSKGYKFGERTGIKWDGRDGPHMGTNPQLVDAISPVGIARSKRVLQG